MWDSDWKAHTSTQVHRQATPQHLEPRVLLKLARLILRGMVRDHKAPCKDLLLLTGLLGVGKSQAIGKFGELEDVSPSSTVILGVF